MRVGVGALVFFFLATTGLVAVGPAARADGASIRAARSHFLAGEFDEAIAMYAALGSDARHGVAAACGRAAVDLLVGEYVEGVVRLEAIEERGRSSADWHASMAALLSATGDYAAAIRHNRRAVSLKPTHLRAHWQLGRALEATGRTDEAVEAYRVFEEMMTEGALPEDAESLTWLGLGFYRYSVLTRDANLVRRTRHVLTEVYQEAFDFVEPGYWPARLAAGELLLAKHKLAEARAEFGRVLSRNPKAADAMVGIGRVDLEVRAPAAARRQAAAALAVNPRHVGAIRLLADARMSEGRCADAATLAQEALRVNPNSVASLGVLAAARTRLGDAAAAVELRERARRVNPRPAAFHFAMGRWLSAGRQYAAAEADLTKAIEMAPSWAEPAAELGLLYMETGQEPAARRTLDAAFKLDSFNLRTHALLKLLDRLDGFARLESEHFVVKYDEDADAVVAPYFSEALESMYEEVCGRYGFRPAKRTIVEVFPARHEFRIRTEGRPFLRTIGASTDRVIALVAPRGEGATERYNWASVLRHEFARVVTLGASANRAPRWLTEGLAASEEPGPRSWATKRLLSDTLRRGRLAALSSIDGMFMRPQGPNDRSLARAQSEWMVEYIVHRARHAGVLGLLKSFGEGKSQRQAFADVLRIEPAAFDRAFADWARGQVKRWGLPTAPVGDVAEIEKRLKAEPEDAALWGELAQARWLDGSPGAAEEAASRALAHDKEQRAALEVMAYVLVARMLGEQEAPARRELIDEADPFIRRWREADAENPTPLKYLAYAEEAWQQWHEAIDLYRRYQKRRPEDPDSYRRLAGILLRIKKEDAALSQLESLFRLSRAELSVARRLGRMYTERGEHDRAAHWYLQAIHIDPYDVNTHGALADAFALTGAYASAEREYKVVTELLPDDPIGWGGLARVCEAMGNSERAAAYQKKADALRGGERKHHKAPAGMDME